MTADIDSRGVCLTRLNPAIATSKNPNVTSNIEGFYLWDLELGQVGFTVRANDRVQLIFDTDIKVSGVLISERTRRDRKDNTDCEPGRAKRHVAEHRDR